MTENGSLTKMAPSRTSISLGERAIVSIGLMPQLAGAARRWATHDSSVR